MNGFVRLVELRMTEIGIRRIDLARATGYSGAHITNLLSGVRVPTPEVVSRFSIALDLSDEERATLNAQAAILAGYGEPT